MENSETFRQCEMIVDQAVKTAGGDLPEAQQRLMRIAYALGQAAKYEASPRFGADHEVTIAYRSIATKDALTVHGEMTCEIELSLGVS